MPRHKNQTGALTIAEKFYIESHKGVKDYRQISRDLNRSMATVTRYANFADTDVKPVEDTTPMLKAGDLMINTSEGGDKRGLAIMTPAAAEHGDEQRKSNAANKVEALHKNGFIVDPTRPIK